MEKELTEIEQKVRTLRMFIKSLTELQYRSECYCCGQPIDKDKTKLLLQRRVIEEQTSTNRMKELKKQLEEQFYKLEHDKEKQERVLLNNESEIFYQQNKSVFNRVTRSYKKGLETGDFKGFSLPNLVTNKEKLLWNHAMEFFHLTTPALEMLDGEEDLLFKIE